jgi:peptidyl-prolyl cis-trans isomerase-like protein 2
MYKSAAHLNYKHSVFGRVVGGMDVLSLMEKVGWGAVAWGGVG